MSGRILHVPFGTILPQESVPLPPHDLTLHGETERVTGSRRYRLSITCEGRSTYVIGVKFAQSLDRDQLLGCFPAVLQRQHLKAALLKGLNPLVKVLDGLGFILHTRNAQACRHRTQSVMLSATVYVQIKELTSSSLIRPSI